MPPEALRPGVNEIIFASKANPGDTSETEIMAGDVLLQGDIQPPWRRLFPTPADNADNESIVDGAYRIRDIGAGSPNLVYPLDAALAQRIDLTFEAMTETANDPLGAMVRAAGGGQVEIVTFQPGRVGLHFAQKSVPFDTEKFHRYRLRMAGGKVSLEADGKPLLEAEAAMPADFPQAKLSGMSYVLPGMDDSSLIFGSLADEGHGVSRWRHVKLRHEAERAVLQDLMVDVKLSAAP